MMEVRGVPVQRWAVDEVEHTFILLFCSKGKEKLLAISGIIKSEEDERQNYALNHTHLKFQRKFERRVELQGEKTITKMPQ